MKERLPGNWWQNSSVMGTESHYEVSRPFADGHLSGITFTDCYRDTGYSVTVGPVLEMTRVTPGCLLF